VGPLDSVPAKALSDFWVYGQTVVSAIAGFVNYQFPTSNVMSKQL
jgi:hypothetical protein